MRFTDIDINFDVIYEDHQNWSKILSMVILRVFSHHHICTLYSSGFVNVENLIDKKPTKIQ